MDTTTAIIRGIHTGGYNQYGQPYPGQTQVIVVPTERSSLLLLRLFTRHQSLFAPIQIMGMAVAGMVVVGGMVTVVAVVVMVVADTVGKVKNRVD